jgi:DNA polymerase I-like protein with 3'-5' exonuclease and polymerase domains
MEVLTEQRQYVTVRTTEHVKAMLRHIAQHEHLAFDVEATGVNVRKDKVVGFSVCGQAGVSFYMPLYEWDVEAQVLKPLEIEGINARRLAKGILGHLGEKKLIMHYGQYDTQVVKHDLGIDLTPALWVDTIMLVHTVAEEGAPGFVKPFGLKEIGMWVQDELGFDAREAANAEQLAMKESVKANGGSITKDNFEIYKADLNLLAEYGNKDTDLTYRICFYFLEKLRAEGLEAFFFDEEVMPVLREVTIPMQARGVRLDLELIERTRQDLDEDLKRYEQRVLDALRPLPQFRKWALTVSNDKFPPKATGNYAQKLAEHFKLDLPVSEKSGKFSITKKTVEALPDSPYKTFLQTGDAEVLPMSERALISLLLWQDANDGKTLNINSKSQMGELVFDFLKVKALSQTKKGADQFNDAFVESLAEKYEWAEELRIYNKLGKIRSSYIERFLQRREGDRYYFTYNQHGTISGRYSSDAQQMPRPKEEGEVSDPIILKYNNAVRAFFICDEGRRFIDCDYESLEPHTFADVAGDEGLKDIFRKRYDFYSTIAIATEKLEGVSADKKAENYLGKVNKPARQKAKSYCLGVPYGMGAYALSKLLDIDIDEAQMLVDAYLDAYPKLREWMLRSELEAKHLGFVKSKVGRVRHLHRVKELFEQFGDKLLNKKNREKLALVHGEDVILSAFLDYKNGLNNAKNWQIQSLATSIVNRAALAINREFKRLGIDACCIAQIHDQIIVDVPQEQAEVCAELVQRCMTETTKLSIELKAPPEISMNWKEGH